MEQLQSYTRGAERVSVHEKTGKVRSIGTDYFNTIDSSNGLQVMTLQEASTSFLTRYGHVFGLSDAQKDLTIVRTTEVENNRSFVKFQQHQSGVPVLGGECIIQTAGSDHRIMSARCEVLPDTVLDVSPKISKKGAIKKALELVSKHYEIKQSELAISEAELWVFNPLLIGMNYNRTSLDWRIVITSRAVDGIRELVFVNAETGIISLNLSLIDNAFNRIVYDNSNDYRQGLPGKRKKRQEGGTAAGISDVDNAYDYSGDTYDFFYLNHGRDSLDDKGMALISTVRYCPSQSLCPYKNAFWNGTQMKGVEINSQLHLNNK